MAAEIMRIGATRKCVPDSLGAQRFCSGLRGLVSPRDGSEITLVEYPGQIAA